MPGCRVALIAAIAVLALHAGAIGAPVATPGWLQAETVPVQVGTGFTPNRPAVALLPNGQVIAVAVTGSNIADLARRSTTRGTWARTAAGIAADPTTYIRPILRVTGGGEVVAAWVQDGIRVATRSTTGTWSAPELVAPAGATIDALSVNAAGAGVLLYRDAGTLTARVRSSSVSPWLAATALGVPAVPGEATASISPNGVLDAVWVDGLNVRHSAGTLATNAWTAPTNLPDVPATLGANFLSIHSDGLGGAYATWIRVCTVHAATRDPGSAVWVSTPPTLPPACGDAGYFRRGIDMNHLGRALIAMAVDTGPGPDDLVVGRRAESSQVLAPFAGITGATQLRAGVGTGDGRFNGLSPVTAVTPNGTGFVALSEGAGDENAGTTAVAVGNISASGVVRNGFVAGSKARRNAVQALHRIPEPAAPPAVADPLNRVNSGLLEWISSNPDATTNLLRVALRPGAGLKLLRVARANVGGRIAARVNLNQPALVTVTFTTPGGRRIGRIVRRVTAGLTTMRLPGASLRPLSAYRVRVTAVNGGASATGRG